MMAFAAGVLLQHSLSAQTCTWGGTSATPSPSVTALRSQQTLLRGPARIAVDAENRLYVVDAVEKHVLVLDERGLVVKSHTVVHEPVAIAIGPAGTIYIADAATGSVSMFDPAWTFLGRLGEGDGEFLQVTDIAVDPDPALGTVFVADGRANVVRVFTAAGLPMFNLGGPGSAVGQFNFPSAVYVSRAGELYVGDQNNDRVQVFDRAGTVRRCFGSRGTSFSRRFGRIQAISGDAGGRVFVADAFQGRVQSFDQQGVLLSTMASFGESAGQLRTPYGMAVDTHGRLFVSSLNGGRVEVLGLDAYDDPHGLAARASVLPAQLRRGTKAPAFILVELPESDVSAIDVTSLRANGIAPAARAAAVGDADGNGVQDLKVRFRTDQLLGNLPAGSASILISGLTRDGAPFEGVAIAEVVQSY